MMLYSDSDNIFISDRTRDTNESHPDIIDDIYQSIMKGCNVPVPHIPVSCSLVQSLGRVPADGRYERDEVY